MVRIPGFHCCALGSIPGQGTEIPQAVRCNKKTKTKPPQKQKQKPNGAQFFRELASSGETNTHYKDMNSGVRSFGIRQTFVTRPYCLLVM